MSGRRHYRGFGRRKPGVWGKVDRTHPLARGLIACWPLAEGGGPYGHNAVDPANDLTFIGTSWKPGNFGAPCLQSAGGGDQAEAATSTLADNLPAMSVMCWFRGGTFSSSDTLMSKLSNSSTGSGWWLEFSAANTLIWFLLQNGSGTFNLASNTTSGTWYDNAWHCAVGTYASLAGAITLYMDGSGLASSASSAGTVTNISNTNKVRLFLNSAATFRPYNGQIALACIWNRTLTATEVTWLYREPFAFMRPTPRRRFAAAAGGGVPILGGGVLRSRILGGYA